MTTTRRSLGLLLGAALPLCLAAGPTPPVGRPNRRALEAAKVEHPASLRMKLEVAPGPAPARQVYKVPVRARDAPGYFRPRRHYAGLLTAMANPTGWKRPGRMGLGVWIEHPDRPPARPYLPHVLHGGDRVRTGPRGLARLQLPGDTVIWVAAETTLRLAGDGPFPGPRERIRVAVEPGLAWVRTPRGRAIEIEVPYGLVHMEWGEVLFEIPTRDLSDEDPLNTARILVVDGRGVIHGRGRHRHRRKRLPKGRTMSWSIADPTYWAVTRTDAAKQKDLQEFFLKLEDGQTEEVEDPPPHSLMQPREVEGLKLKRAVLAAGDGSPAPGKKTKKKKTKKKKKKKKKPDDPFADPFGDDPFADPFSDDF